MLLVQLFLLLSCFVAIRHLSIVTGSQVQSFCCLTVGFWETPRGERYKGLPKICQGFVTCVTYSYFDVFYMESQLLSFGSGLFPAKKKQTPTSATDPSDYMVIPNSWSHQMTIEFVLTKWWSVPKNLLRGYPSPESNGKHTNLKMYFLLKTEIVQPVMLVFRGVTPPLKWFCEVSLFWISIIEITSPWLLSDWHRAHREVDTPAAVSWLTGCLLLRYRNIHLCIIYSICIIYIWNVYIMVCKKQNIYIYICMIQCIYIHPWESSNPPMEWYSLFWGSQDL